MITNELIKSGQMYPEISRKNGRIVTESVKDYLYKNNLISAADYDDPNCDYGIIARGILAAFKSGILSLNCTKQKGITNNTPVRMSTTLGGKMRDVWAFSTLSLCNNFCLQRMKNPALVCAYCYVKKSLHISAILNYVQNFYVLTAGILPAAWIPEINPKNAEKHPLIRLEAFGDLATYEQTRNYLSIAYNNPEFRFGLWTKNPRIFAAAVDDCGKPENLSSVLSMSRVNKFDDNDGKYFPWYFDHRFIVVDDENIKNQILVDPRAYSCKCGPRSCITCKQCYKKNPDYITAVEMLRK